MPEHKTLTFSIEGKIITDIAREHFYVRNDMAKALDLLCAGLQSDKLDDYERMALALRVLDGKAEIRGTYPGDGYGFYDLDEPEGCFITLKKRTSAVCCALWRRGSPAA